jgi:hypothetical protein
MMVDLPRISNNATLPETILEMNTLIDQFNFLSSRISLKENFDGDMVTIIFAAGETKVIPHKLGKVPGGRIIIKQEGNGVLSDIPSGWNSTSIKMINNGAVQVTATMLIVRE